MHPNQENQQNYSHNYPTQNYVTSQISPTNNNNNYPKTYPHYHPPINNISPRRNSMFATPADLDIIQKQMNIQMNQSVSNPTSTSNSPSHAKIGNLSPQQPYPMNQQNQTNQQINQQMMPMNNIQNQTSHQNSPQHQSYNTQPNQSMNTNYNHIYNPNRMNQNNTNYNYNNSSNYPKVNQPQIPQLNIYQNNRYNQQAVVPYSMNNQQFSEKDLELYFAMRNSIDSLVSSYIDKFPMIYYKTKDLENEFQQRNMHQEQIIKQLENEKLELQKKVSAQEIMIQEMEKTVKDLQERLKQELTKSSVKDETIETIKLCNYDLSKSLESMKDDMKKQNEEFEEWKDSLSNNTNQTLINHWNSKLHFAKVERVENVERDEIVMYYKFDNQQNPIGRYVIVNPTNPNTNIIKLHQRMNRSNKNCVDQKITQQNQPVIFVLDFEEYEICCYSKDSLENLSYNYIQKDENHN